MALQSTIILLALPEEGDDLFAKVDQLRRHHLHIPVRPAEGIADKAPHVGGLSRLVEGLDADPRKLNAELLKFLLRFVQNRRLVLHICFPEPVPLQPERLVQGLEVSSQLESFRILLDLRRKGHINTVNKNKNETVSAFVTILFHLAA